MTNEIENLIRKSMAKDIEIAMIESEIAGIAIDSKVVLGILGKLIK